MALSRGGSPRLAYGPRPARPKTFHHPEVGDLTLGHQSMELEGTPGHRLVVHPAEPDTPEYDARVLLDILGSQPSPAGRARPEPSS
ncbi:MmyB family transcriptional regulator [Streptomyces sp. NPDC004393]|uniref:MmyB family transcriptional regulator n=1 Tax=Streptomyces sp. NPDC004533 TaxID=3154278 RepID=UPI0033B7DEBE